MAHTRAAGRFPEVKPYSNCPPVQKASDFAPCASAPGRVPLSCSHWPRSRVGLPRPRPFPAARRTPITDTDTQNLEVFFASTSLDHQRAVGELCNFAIG